jgi:hypothetical protein
MSDQVAEVTPLASRMGKAVVMEDPDLSAAARPEPQANIAPDVIVDVTCPSCATPARVNTTRREADDFCVQCEYPLFWAVERPAPTAASGLTDTGLRRLPGTAGRAVLAFLNCPVCTEPNPPASVHCSRCGSELRPAAVVAVVEPEPVPEPVVELVPARRRNWWVIGLAAATVLALLVLALVLLLDQG